MPRRLIAVVIGALVGMLVLTGCRLDVEVDAVIDADGTGSVTVTARADAAFVARVPDLVESLDLSDALAAGWEVEGPTPTDDGGLEVVVTRAVSGPQELANALGSIGPPLVDVAAGRATDDEGASEHVVTGTLQLDDEMASFADADLIAAVGGVPWQRQLDAADTSVADAVTFTLRLMLPGVVVDHTGEDVGNGVIGWSAPMDGSSVTIELTTIQRADSGSSWARPLAVAAFVGLLAWIAISVLLVVAVVNARRRRATRRRTPPRHATGRPTR